MARYLGPKHKLCRREGVPLCDSPKCPARGKRKYPPGLHGQRRRRGRQSIYGKQLRAKQRTKRLYGMLERQFRRFFKEAEKKSGSTGDNLLRMLESRLDNVVYRLGLANSRPQARQAVTHRHIFVNGKCVNIPSYIVSKEDKISLSPQGLKTTLFKEMLGSMAKKDRPNWLLWDSKTRHGKVVETPDITGLVDLLEPNMTVELYSK